MRLYPGLADPSAILGMKAKTFFALLNEGHKLDIQDKRFSLTASSYPHMDKEGQEQVSQALVLSDDLLSDILEEENIDNAESIRSMFEE